LKPRAISGPEANRASECMLIFLSHRCVIFTLQRGQYHLDWPAFFSLEWSVLLHTYKLVIAPGIHE
jgi:hypothetical protein